MARLWGNGNTFPVPIFKGKKAAEKLHKEARQKVLLRLAQALQETSAHITIPRVCWGGPADNAALRIGQLLEGHARQPPGPIDDRKSLRDHISSAKQCHQAIFEEMSKTHDSVADDSAASRVQDSAYLSMPRCTLDTMNSRFAGSVSGESRSKSHVLCMGERTGRGRL